MNYEYEEAQVKIDLSDMILEHLVDELVGLLNHKGTGGQRTSSVEIEELSPDRKTPTPNVRQAKGGSIERLPPTSPFLTDALVVPQQEAGDNLSQKRLSGDKTISA